jgi:hypothetical protein
MMWVVALRRAMLSDVPAFLLAAPSLTRSSLSAVHMPSDGAAPIRAARCN